MLKPKYFEEIDEIYGYRPIINNIYEASIGLPSTLPVLTSPVAIPSPLTDPFSLAGPSTSVAPEISTACPLSRKRPVVTFSLDEEDEDPDDPVIETRRPKKKVCKKLTPRNYKERLFEVIVENAKDTKKNEKKIESHIEKMEKLMSDMRTFMERMVTIEEEKLECLKEIRDKGKKNKY